MIRRNVCGLAFVRSVTCLPRAELMQLIVFGMVMATGHVFAQESSVGNAVRKLEGESGISGFETSKSLDTAALHEAVPADAKMPQDFVSSISEIYCRLRSTSNNSAIEELLSTLSRFSDTYTDDLPGLLERKTIRVLIASSPTNFFVSGGRIYGFEYSLLKEYERFLSQNNSNNDLKTVVEFIPVWEELLIPSLVKGLGDIVAAGLVVTERSNPNFEFSDPYLSDVSEVLVSNRDMAPIQNLHDVAGKQIYVRRVRSHYESLGRLNEQLKSQGLAPVSIIKAEDYVTNEDILEMLNAGIISLSVIESHLAELWSGVLPNLRVHDQLPLRQGATLAWMVRKSNPLLKESLNEFVKHHKKGTLLGNIYFNRYFKDTKWITNPLDTNGREKSFRYAPLFKKYGAEYNIDWMLLSALGYQESLLEHNRRSPKGAIGIMQIMPSTAMDPRVNITDYHLIEKNIHAGAKYLALLRDTYFNESEMEPIVRLRYALAAYNAGPANIIRARALAAEMGYDPNRWFLHGEIGALKLIGQETVRYVSNVNKFYLAYSLADTLDCLKDKESENFDSRPSKGFGTMDKEKREVPRH
jgi:membrane-bound lytic murein transglycosylase MltF